MKYQFFQISLFLLVCICLTFSIPVDMRSSNGSQNSRIINITNNRINTESIIDTLNNIESIESNAVETRINRGSRIGSSSNTINTINIITDNRNNRGSGIGSSSNISNSIADGRINRGSKTESPNNRNTNIINNIVNNGYESKNRSNNNILNNPIDIGFGSESSNNSINDILNNRIDIGFGSESSNNSNNDILNNPIDIGFGSESSNNLNNGIISNPTNNDLEAGSSKSSSNEIVSYEKDDIKKIDLSVYLSSIDNFFRSKDISRNISYSRSKQLDIYYSKNDRTKKPVVIYLYGGNWSLGEKSLYSKLGDFLRENDFVTVIPNYTQLPFGNVDDMIRDVSNAIIWVYKNIGRFSGDNQNIILLGHSSGAHIAALTLFVSSLNIKTPGYAGALPILQRAVLLNGPYDFDALSDDAKRTGKVPENSEYEKNLLNKLGSRVPCPTDILKYFRDKSIRNLGAKRFDILHSEKDTVIPLIASKDLKNQIQRVSNIPATIYTANGMTHSGITEGVMRGDKFAQYILKDILTNTK